MKKTDKPTYSTAAPNKQPTQLIEMAGLEIRRRALSQELAHVNSEMSRLNLEIRVLGIEIPWLAREQVPESVEQCITCPQCLRGSRPLSGRGTTRGIW